jgi:hypothetical protein
LVTHGGLVDANSLLACLTGPTFFAGHGSDDLDPVSDRETGGVGADLNNLTGYFMANDLRGVKSRVTVVENFGVGAARGAGLDPYLELVCSCLRGFDVDNVEVSWTGKHGCSHGLNTFQDEVENCLWVLGGSKNICSIVVHEDVGKISQYLYVTVTRGGDAYTHGDGFVDPGDFFLESDENKLVEVHVFA